MDYESFKEKFVEDLKDRLDEQGADVLAADVGWQGDGASFQRLSRDTQGRETCFADIVYIGTQRAQGIHQNADGTVSHTLCPCDGVSAWRDAEIGGEEAHSCACGLDVNHFGHIGKCRDHHLCVVAVGQVFYCSVQRLAADGGWSG